MRIAERIADDIEPEACNDVYISHADCPDAAEELAGYLKERIANEKIVYHFGDIGPIVGGSSGPGTVIAFCFGKEVGIAGDK